MVIQFNQEKLDISDLDVTSLTNILIINGYTGGSYAVMLNGIFVPRSQYEQTQVYELDSIDIVIPMQGG